MKARSSLALSAPPCRYGCTPIAFAPTPAPASRIASRNAGSKPASPPVVTTADGSPAWTAWMAAAQSCAYRAASAMGGQKLPFSSFHTSYVTPFPAKCAAAARETAANPGTVVVANAGSPGIG